MANLINTAVLFVMPIDPNLSIRIAQADPDNPDGQKMLRQPSGSSPVSLPPEI